MISSAGLRWLSVLCVLPLAVACGTDEAPADGPTAGQGQLGLTVDVLADTDISGFAFKAVAVDCATGVELVPPVVSTTTRDLEDMLIPGGNPHQAGRPYDASSAHLFADAFMWLDAGCYDVTAQPLDIDGNASADCAAAGRQNVSVSAGGTTEITLISQCRGVARGGLDVIATVNHAPQIDNLAYDPSKFTCEAETTVCLVASDPDNDPLAISWQGDGANIQLISQSQTALEGGQTRFCATFGLAEPGSYTVSAVIQDLAYDAAGNLVPIEDLLAQQVGGGNSRATVKMPIHAMDDAACIGLCTCPEGFELNAAGDACTREEVVPAEFNGQFFQVCRGSTEHNYGALGALLPGGTILTNHAFFGGNGTVTNNVDQNTRLNNIGVWGCNGEEPTRQWIGFSACVDLPEDGEYVVGIAGDDLVRFRVDGVPVFAASPAGGQANFRYWNLVPVQLTAGGHVLELEGYNSGSEAAFGAEIYGPFPVGSTIDDASIAALNFADNVAWTTGDQVGQNFDLGTDNGWSCPDGAALNLCEGEPICRRTEILACGEDAPADADADAEIIP